jgi:hypothetical protein
MSESQMSIDRHKPYKHACIAVRKWGTVIVLVVIIMMIIINLTTN